MIGSARALALYAAPTSWMNVTGAVDAFDVACARLFPRGDRPRPSTLIVGSTRFGRVELRTPEPRLVRLVSDQEMLHPRVRPRDLRAVRRERVRPVRRGRD